MEDPTAKASEQKSGRWTSSGGNSGGAGKGTVRAWPGREALSESRQPVPLTQAQEASNCWRGKQTESTRSSPRDPGCVHPPKGLASVCEFIFYLFLFIIF